ncbi:MAG: PAS domain-containing sensor histidine kinase [Campylobacterales bacterium]|nr:PAS domain-containing sensor histidine kinase [Campylobacterales bacterium]
MVKPLIILFLLLTPSYPQKTQLEPLSQNFSTTQDISLSTNDLYSFRGEEIKRVIIISLMIFLLITTTILSIVSRRLKFLVKEKTKELAETEHLFKQIYELLPIGITITDKKGNIVDCNKSSQQILGYSKEEHLAKNYKENWEIIKEDGSIFPPDDYPSVKALDNKTTYSNEIMGVNTPNGLKWLNVSATYLGVPNYGVVVTYFDLTEKKEYEDLINKEKLKLNQIFNSQNDLAVITDGEKLHSANKSLLDFFNYSSIEEFKEEQSCICDLFEGDGFEIDFELLTKDDKETWFEKVLKDPNKNYKVSMKDHFFAVNGKKITENEELYIFTFTDITIDHNYKKQLEHDIAIATEKMDSQYQEFLQASKKAAMGDLIGIIAHQLKQPLNGLSLGKEVLVENYNHGELTEEEVEKYSKRVSKQIQFMSKSIDDLRNFFRPDKTTQFYFVDDAVKKSLDLISTQINSKGIEIVLNCNSRVQLEGFENEFQQVVLNIVTNAKDALLQTKPHDPKIEISTFKENGKVFLTVKDNGGGVPDNIKDKIFNSYFTTKGESGTGIGLNLVKMIIEGNIGGSIDVENIESGALFKIAIPLKDNQ